MYKHSWCRHIGNIIPNTIIWYDWSHLVPSRQWPYDDDILTTVEWRNIWQSILNPNRPITQMVLFSDYNTKFFYFIIYPSFLWYYHCTHKLISLLLYIAISQCFNLHYYIYLNRQILTLYNYNVKFNSNQIDSS